MALAGSRTLALVVLAGLAVGRPGVQAVAPAAHQDAPPAFEPLPELGGAAYVIVPQARSFAVRPGPEAIVIDAVRVRAEIVEQAARTTMDIALSNTSGTPAEAVLLLPVPDGAVVGEFVFEGAASEPTARVLPDDEARRLYDSIVRRVRDPALLEFAGYHLIRSSVFPVPAGGTQRLRLSYDHLLASDGNRVDYVIPRSESLARRRPWDVTASIRSAHPISTVYSPSHELVMEDRKPTSLTVRIREAASREPGSFRLSYLLEREGVSASLFAYPDPAVGGGYFLLMAGLPAAVDPAARIKREVTVVIDRSGSMAGPKLDQVRAAALQVIEGLADGEAFNIIDYASAVSSYAPGPVARTRQSALDARAYLGSIRPSGGTNIHDALLEALRQKPVASRLPLVLFLTDGLPTIGRTGETDIREMVARGNLHGRRIFTIGVGEDVNVPLLDRVAESTRATASYVLPGEDVELEVARVYRRLYGPVFAEPALATTNSAGEISTRLVQELIPARLPDLFEGDQLILLGQYRREEPVTFTFRGEYLGEPREFSFTFDLGASDRGGSVSTANAFVPRLWASRRIGLLIDQLRQAGAEAGGQPRMAGRSPLLAPRYQELVDEIVRLSTRFGILTEYTSFLATEGTDLGDWDGLVEGCCAQLDARAVRCRSGLGAVNQGLNVWRQREQVALNYGNRYLDERLQPVALESVQQMCDRAFFRRGGRWVDSRLVALPQLEPHEVLEPGSEAHLALLHRLAAEGRQGLLSLPGEILVEIDGRIVMVKEAS